jgi:hypothetical protein
VNAWKACERKVAALLGGKRVPVSGRTRGDSPDVRHEHLSIEVKSRRRLPAWIEDAMKQAEACAKEGQLPIAVFHQDGKKYREALVVVRLSELANLVKGER